MKELVTIFAATCKDIALHQEALALASLRLPVPHKTLLYQPPAPWSKLEQTQFLTHHMKDHIETPFVMTIHLDGFPLHRDLWSHEFLAYDYIGAPWPPENVHGAGCRVGNSGFTIRSRKWLEATAKLPLPNIIEEDIWCCQDHYYDMIQTHGCAIAPLELALRFSFENPVPEFPGWNPDESYGFHGPFRPESLRKL